MSGQTAWDANRQLVGGTHLADQSEKGVSESQTIVEASGGTISDVVSLRSSRIGLDISSELPRARFGLVAI